MYIGNMQAKQQLTVDSLFLSFMNREKEYDTTLLDTHKRIMSLFEVQNKKKI